MANYKEGSEEAEKRKKKITVYGSQAEYNAAHKKEIEAGTMKASNTVVHARGVDRQNPESVKNAMEQRAASIDSWRVSQGLEPHSDKYWSKTFKAKYGVDYNGYDPSLTVKYDLDRKQQEAANLAPLMKASAQSVSGAGAEQAQRNQKTMKPVSSATMSNFRQLDNGQKTPTPTATSTGISGFRQFDNAEAQKLSALAAKQATTPAQAALNATQTQQSAKVYSASPAVQTKSAIGQMIAGTSNKQPAQSTPSTAFLSPALKSRIQTGENIAKQTLALDRDLMNAKDYGASLINNFRSAPSAAITGGAQMVSDLLGGNKTLGGVEDARAVRQKAQEQLQNSLKGKSQLEQTLMQGVYSLVENVSIMLFSPVKGAVLPLMGASAASDAYNTYKTVGVPTGEAVTRAATEGVISGFIEGIGGIGAGGAISKLANRTLASSLSKILGRDVSGALASLSTKLIPSVLANAGSEAFEEVAEYPLQAAVAYLYNYAFGNTAGDVPASWQEALAEVKRNASAAAVAGALFGGANFLQNQAQAPTANPTAPQENAPAPTVGTAPEANATATIDGQAAGLPYNAFSGSAPSNDTAVTSPLSAGAQAATGTDVLNPTAQTADHGDRANTTPTGKRIYIGMGNTPVDVITKTYVGSDYRVHTDYYTPDGKPLELVATRDSAAYFPASNYEQYRNSSQPVILKGTVVSPEVLEQGYSGHDFAIANSGSQTNAGSIPLNVAADTLTEKADTVPQNHNGANAVEQPAPQAVVEPQTAVDAAASTAPALGKGEYYILAHGKKLGEFYKKKVSGKIITVDGRSFGIKKSEKGKGYEITDIKTGLLANRGGDTYRTQNDVVAYLQELMRGPLAATITESKEAFFNKLPIYTETGETNTPNTATPPTDATTAAPTQYADATVGTDAVNPAAQKIDEAFANGLPEGEPSFGSATVGAAERNPKSYYALMNEYGTLPEGENPARTVDVPAQTSPTDKVGRFTRTLMEAQITPEEYMGEYEKLVEKGVFSYQSESDQEAFNKAVQHAAEVPFGNVAAEFDGLFRNNKALDKDSLFLGQLVYATAIKNGDTELAMKTAAQLVVAGTETGRAEQAFRFMKKISSETVNEFGQRVNVYYWELMADRLSKRFNADIKLDNGLIKNLSEAKTEEDVQKANDALKANLAKQIPSDTMAKWTAWRYMSMLGNLKTFERNLLGNVVMAPVRGMKEVIKAGIQRTGWAKKRGATITTTTAMPTQVQKDFSKADFDYMREEIMGANKYNDELNSIVQDRTIFQFAPLEATRRGINWAMNNGFFGDEAFAKIAFVDAEAKYFRANNIDPKSASANEINNAREYAINESRNATYRQANKLAQAIIRAGRSSKLAGFFKDAYIPFVTTPLNVLETGVNYSPIGLIRALTYDCHQVKNGKMTADAMIDHLSSGIVGSGVSMLGYFMAAMGMVTGGEGDNDKENSWFDLNGGQHYAIKIGDGSYTIDWLTPVCIPLFMGVELYRSLHDEYTLENASDLVDAVIATVNRTAEPMFGLSMLQGISNVLLRQSYKTEGRAVGFLGDAAASLISQNIPTVLGQLARTIAPNAQNARFIDKTDNMPDAAQRILNQILVKTPGSQWAINQLGGGYQIPERINAWGEKENPPLGERILENFFSPGYWEKSDDNTVNQGIEALYDKTGDLGVLPSTLQKYYTVDGKNIYFSTEEYEKAQEIAGKTSKRMLEKLFSSPAYRGMTDTQKKDWVTDIYEYAKQTAKTQVVGVKYDTTRIERYKETGLGTNGQVQLYRILESESESAEQDARIAETFGVDEYTARDYRRKATGKYYYTLEDRQGDDEKTAAKAALLGEYGFSEDDVLACYNANAGSGQNKADYIADATYALINQGYSEKDAKRMAFYFYAVANSLEGFKVE